jgi:hypothetical protein
MSCDMTPYGEISEEQRQEMTQSLPERINEHHELLIADAADLDIRRKRIQQLVGDINEVNSMRYEKYSLLT